MLTSDGQALIGAAENKILISQDVAFLSHFTKIEEGISALFLGLSLEEAQAAGCSLKK